MILVAFTLVVVGICVLGAVYGSDSRHSEPHRHHPTLL
jgi:hypothetical protein